METSPIGCRGGGLTGWRRPLPLPGTQVQPQIAGRIPIGSHEDTTVEHVLEAFDCGATLSEMPCSIEAARKAKELGMVVCMGAPNYYRGGSHCGNLSGHDAMAENLVDIICSDYHFPSLLACAIRMMECGMPPSAAINMLTLHPARHLRMDGEIGSIVPGKRADLVAFHPRSGFSDVVRVWVRGEERFSVPALGAAQEAVRSQMSITA